MATNTDATENLTVELIQKMLKERDLKPDSVLGIRSDLNKDGRLVLNLFAEGEDGVRHVLWNWRPLGEDLAS